jgi:hypothetical protein
MILGMPHIIKVASHENPTGTSLMEVIVGPGQGVPQHVHTREDEIFCVLQGELTCQGPCRYEDPSYAIPISPITTTIVATSG